MGTGELVRAESHSPLSAVAAASVPMVLFLFMFTISDYVANPLLQGAHDLDRRKHSARGRSCLFLHRELDNSP